MNRRTLTLGLGLVLMLICVEALLISSHIRPIFRVMELVLPLAAWALIQWMLLSRPISAWERAALRDWAQSQGFALVRCAHSPLHDRAARERDAANGYLYFVRVRDAEGNTRSAWVRLQFRHAQLEVVRYRWES